MKKSYRDIARDLKRLGLVDYDLRKSLSTGQKSQITKLAQTWGHFLNHPEKFHTARVSSQTAKQLQDAGFKVTPRKLAVIPLYEYSTAHIDGRKGEIVYGNAVGLRERTMIVDHKNFLPQLKSLSKKKLPRNAMISIRIGDRSRFGRKFTSWHAVYKYIDEWQPNDPGANKEELIAQMSIVEVPIDPKPRRKASAKKKASPAKKRRT